MSFEPSDRRNRFLYLRCHACRISACRLLGLRARTRLELDTFAMPWGVPEPNHRCKAWGGACRGARQARHRLRTRDAGAKWRVPMQRRTKKLIVTWMAAQRLSPNVPPEAERLLH